MSATCACTCTCAFTGTNDFVSFLCFEFKFALTSCCHPSLQVMLLSLQAGGVGLNLIGANHVFIVDMHWNPALEEQAADRCHRMGQKKDVFIHR